ncbi:hypothetical protein Goklo_027909 [Gossypium klotzschianum]|uniref:Uncharacterized protein n=1 Tax=Gossypium klotzschianum TaxID=34286 RepID=A0A7J8TZT3_9ROSI|nr:hypothetical protein [Gossypium klotzschianum]
MKKIGSLLMGSLRMILI